MTLALEMRSSIVALAGSRGDYDTRESMIARAARKAGISFRQAKALFYGETVDPRHSVVEKVRAATNKEASEAAHAAHVASIRFATLAARLQAVDPDLYGQQASQFLGMAGKLRDLGD